MKVSKVSSLFVISLLALVASNTASAVVILGQGFRPDLGANFSISAVEGVDIGVNPLGLDGFNPKVNRDFEFDNSFGVSYDLGNGTLKDFGLGLYADANGVTRSTGLRINYDNLVSASSVSVLVQDFDIKAGKDKFFNPQKVEPVLLLIGANNTIFAKADPTALFSALTPVTALAGQATGDVWRIDFGKVLQNLNIADGEISGFILAADMAHGEKPNSDPYLLISIGNGIPAVPEADTYMVGLFGIGVALVSVKKLKKSRANVS
jgi:hypothetical protein